ncbi:4'-phosphopantetheinyl transferase superfamily protein [Paenibacillus sp. EKM102P]|uniref:4'-phosphopantetheinyl transferase family protein n=1 Tax=unclassified Paenibacillus TaxID=185978 RepID=UPI00142E7227|nr:MULTISPECIES: 4'-phosphopantetheinyl transferase superfamily protein [unclassified Paenibacillus]KAF6619222.1 4'-phosphopantetheinyl transferase superfamily protein [Paenibacillus sp. EKM101P]KAF6624313.1 4'-phosphopantetheinyl transferase superfamily protein [Paenibacillus sp. EKM102P]KAF6635911.1 4'-phosphopantetheinyl transferase superfamily protein [Paenibacillus sp. EKM10P]KAF6648384.1 4'-phosphopantetheinyl transferase superfamily protein [Paenibacillus sp. EKM11P]
MEIYAIDTSKPEAERHYELLVNQVTLEKQHKLDRFLHREDALRGLYADVLLRWLVCRQLKIPNASLQFTYNAFGKPSLLNAPAFHFNVSHSGKWVVCAIDDHPLGIDIEQLRPIDFEVGRVCFSDTEYDALMQQDAESRLSYFYDLWTLKESFVKAEGQGLTLPLKSFSFELEARPSIGFTTEGFTTEYCHFKQYELDPDYKMAVCAAHDHFAQEVQQVDINTLRLEVATLA